MFTGCLDELWSCDPSSVATAAACAAAASSSTPALSIGVATVPNPSCCCCCCCCLALLHGHEPFEAADAGMIDRHARPVWYTGRAAEECCGTHLARWMIASATIFDDRRLRRPLAENTSSTVDNFSWANWSSGGCTGFNMADGSLMASSSRHARRAKRPTELALVPRRLPVPSTVEVKRTAPPPQLAPSAAPELRTQQLQQTQPRLACFECSAAPCQCWRELNLRRQTFLDCDNRLVSEDSYGYMNSASADDGEGGRSGCERSLELNPEVRARRANDTGLGATHRATHKFVPRHDDEAALDIGDSVHVTEECEDLWCRGINLRTGSCGIFPSVCLTDLKFYEIGLPPAGGQPLAVKQPRARAFRVRFLGSMEVKRHKGTEVIAEAIQKVLLARRLSEDSQTAPLCRLEVSEAGVKMIDLTQNKNLKKALCDIKACSISEKLQKLLSFHKESKAVSSHFFALKNISYCGLHPSSERYFAFITKHPTTMRFACHCYASLEGSTQDISEAIGEAFNKFYMEYLAFSHQTEDIYLE